MSILVKDGKFTVQLINFVTKIYKLILTKKHLTVALKFFFSKIWNQFSNEKISLNLSIIDKVLDGSEFYYSNGSII